MGTLICVLYNTDERPTCTGDVVIDGTVPATKMYTIKQPNEYNDVKYKYGKSQCHSKFNRDARIQIERKLALLHSVTFWRNTLPVCWLFTFRFKLQNNMVTNGW